MSVRRESDNRSRFALVTLGLGVVLLGTATLSASVSTHDVNLVQTEIACAAACGTCDMGTAVSKCDDKIPWPHSAAAEVQDMALAASCADKYGCKDCLLCKEQQNGAAQEGAHAMAAAGAATSLSEQRSQGFFSALQTSGSFTMMQAGGF